MKEAGLTIREDIMGNTFARWEGSDPQAGVDLQRYEKLRSYPFLARLSPWDPCIHNVSYVRQAHKCASSEEHSGPEDLQA